MPTYQYACTECGHAFEQFQSFSDDALTECPECAGRLRKLFNAVGVVFKGSGFYRNDSRAPAPSEGAAATASSGSSGEKSEGSKPAAATPATSSPAPSSTAPSSSSTSKSSPQPAAT